MEGVEHIYHYLDDFAMVGQPQSRTRQMYLDILAKTSSEMGVPLAPEKKGGP